MFSYIHMSKWCILWFLCVLHGDTGIWVSARGVKRSGVDPDTSDNPKSNAIQEKWLDDYTKDFLNEMQSDSAGGTNKVSDDSNCPPPPNHVTQASCAAPKCQSDKECAEFDQICCYNGCTFTCMTSMPPPALVDWWNEPPRRLQSGNSWLVPGSDQDDTDSQVEPCSTSGLTDDEDPLLCPHGFICHIDNPGNPAKDIPNSGKCVKENDHLGDSRRKFRLKTEKIHQGLCVFQNAIFPDGASFYYDTHQCTCNKGSINCRVGRRGGI